MYFTSVQITPERNEWKNGKMGSGTWNGKGKGSKTDKDER